MAPLRVTLGRVLIKLVLYRGSPNVRYAPKTTELLRCREVTQRANNCREQVRQNFAYSITFQCCPASLSMTRSTVLLTPNGLLQRMHQRGSPYFSKRDSAVAARKSICGGDQVCVAILKSGVFTPLRVIDQYHVAPDFFSSRRNNKK